MDKLCNVTNMPKKYCAHCKNLVNPVNKNDLDGYSIKEFHFRGNPMIEILINGGPVNDFDSNFMFGLSKAKMLMNCITEIERFAFLPKEKLNRKTKKEKIIGNSKVIIEYFPNFTTSYGKTIKLPYINIIDSDVHIGIGQKKAEAVFELKEEIMKWIKNNSKI